MDRYWTMIGNYFNSVWYSAGGIFTQGIFDQCQRQQCPVQIDGNCTYIGEISRQFEPFELINLRPGIKRLDIFFQPNNRTLSRKFEVIKDETNCTQHPKDKIRPSTLPHQIIINEYDCEYEDDCEYEYDYEYVTGIANFV